MAGPGGQDGGGAERLVFRGVSQLALDAKGRLAIPAKHREALVAAHGNGGAQGVPLVLTADPSRCLLLYPREEWEPIQARLMRLSSFNDVTRGVQRLLVGHADDVEMDATGRILVPPALRQYAALDHRVVLVGQGHKFELWDEARWLAEEARDVEIPADVLSRELSDFSL